MDKIIKCPVCNEVMSEKENLLLCVNNHSFDRAKQGYYNVLITNSSSEKIKGDSAEMLKARQKLFSNGYYEVVSDEINNTVRNYIKEHMIILDIGSGVGYYLDRLENSQTSKNSYYGVDLSKDATKISSTLNKNIQYVVGTNNKLPFIDNSIDIMISVFSPIYLEECKRVLKNDGVLIVVHPNQNHLIQMKKVIYDDIILKEENRNELDPKFFSIVESKDVKYDVEIDNENIKNLLMMTPHFWTSTLKGKERLYSLKELNVSIDIKIDVYKLS